MWCLNESHESDYTATNLFDLFIVFFWGGTTFKIVFPFRVRNRASPGSLQSLFQSKCEVFVMVSSSTFNLNETDRHNRLRN